MAGCLDIIDSTGKIPESYPFPDIAAGISPGDIVVAGYRFFNVTLGDDISDIPLKGQRPPCLGFRKPGQFDAGDITDLLPAKYGGTLEMERPAAFP